MELVREHQLARDMYQLALERTDEFYTPIVRSYEIPEVFVYPVMSSRPFSKETLIGSYGLLIDAISQSAYNELEGPGGRISDSPTSLAELFKLLNRSGETVVNALALGDSDHEVFKAFERYALTGRRWPADSPSYLQNFPTIVTFALGRVNEFSQRSQPAHLPFTG